MNEKKRTAKTLRPGSPTTATTPVAARPSVLRQQAQYWLGEAQAADALCGLGADAISELSARQNVSGE